MNGVLYPLCASLAWVSLLFKLPGLLRRDRGAAAVAVGFFYLFMALTFTISDPRVWAALDRVMGVPNLALVLSQGSVMGVAASQLAALTHWDLEPDRARPLVRRRIWAFGAVFAAMVALFAAADLTEEDTTTAAVRFAGHGVYSVYLMLYVTAFAVTEYLIVVRCLRYARAVAGTWLRRGLRLAATGALGGLVYAAARYADVVARPLGLDPQRWEVVAQLGAGLGAICTLIGWSLPGWGPQVRWLRSWWRAHRAYSALYPLWAALMAANPGLALDRAAGRWAMRDLDFRLHRRVIEIQDGLRWLRPPHDDNVAAADADLRAHFTAMAIAESLTERAAGRARGASASERTGSETTSGRAGSETTNEPVGGAPATERAGGAPASGRVGEEPASEPVGGETAGEQAGGAPAGERAGGASAGEVVGGISAAETVGGTPGRSVATTPVTEPPPQETDAAWLVRVARAFADLDQHPVR
ncbi:MAB_1171c family putative transporter [Actinokineospora diospyrosa]|uniref:DUF6545 domain-containing protein n=1 Tax=Actinokineospora diospyrosa TaxID=103728 RepID=A0ABT1IFP5_9PSEU|nr:MAB_1171c family putative transporter [Actinokineospora diospyrosa]MCP2271460.1 hypothetical protein [Actinokineospora diospyrosa]